jgi:hypothetical protein
MKSVSNEASSKSLSDLERAKAMSRTLSRAAEPAHPPAATQAYTRLAKSTPLTLPTTPLDTPMMAPLPPLPVGTRWPDIVRWAQVVTEAHAAFAVDAKGLLVSAIGMEDDDATRMGGRLALAFDQSAQIDVVRSMVIDWAGETVTVLETRDGDDVPVLLGLLGHRKAVPVAALVGSIHASLARESWKTA